MTKPRVVRHAVEQPLRESYRFIPLTQGQNAIVDVEDFNWLSQWNWIAFWSPITKSFYACRGAKHVAMHRQILQCANDEFGDHRNHDTLDNRRANLRKCTRGENNKNQRIPRNSTSGYKGVHRVKESGRWRARINVNGKRIFIGDFTSPEAAARAYDTAAIKHHGDFAYLNFRD
jgi:hypothetical protein